MRGKRQKSKFGYKELKKMRKGRKTKFKPKTKRR